MLTQLELVLELLYEASVFLEFSEQVRVGLEDLFVEGVVVGFVDEDDVECESFGDLGHRLARKDDLVETVDQSGHGLFLDPSFRFRARLVTAPQGIAKMLADLFAAHHVVARDPFPRIVLAKKAVPLFANRVDDVRDDHRSL